MTSSWHRRTQLKSSGNEVRHGCFHAQEIEGDDILKNPYSSLTHNYSRRRCSPGDGSLVREALNCVVSLCVERHGRPCVGQTVRTPEESNVSNMQMSRVPV